MKEQGHLHRSAAAFLTAPETDGMGKDVPNVCLKIPTGGGKTRSRPTPSPASRADFFSAITGGAAVLLARDRGDPGHLTAFPRSVPPRRHGLDVRRRRARCTGSTLA